MSALLIAIVVVPMAASCLFAVALSRVAGSSDERMDQIRPELYRRSGGAGAMESATFSPVAEPGSVRHGLTESAA